MNNRLNEVDLSLNLWEVFCVVKFLHDRPAEDIYTDIRAIPGITIVNNLSKTQKQFAGSSVNFVKLHLRFVPKAPIKTYMALLKQEMGKIAGVLGVVFLSRSLDYIGKRGNE